MSDLTIEEQCIPEKCKDDLVSRREVYKDLLACKTGWDFSQALMNMPSAEPDLEGAYASGYTDAEAHFHEIIIRCKDCKHWYLDADTGMACEFTNMSQPKNGFCNWAERRTDE